MKKLFERKENGMFGAINEQNYDKVSGTPLTDEAWAKSGEEFFSTPWGNFIRQTHIKGGGKFNTQNGVPIDGIRKFPIQFLGNFYNMFQTYYKAEKEAKEDFKKYWDARDKETQQLKQQAELETKQAQELIKKEQEKIIQKLGIQGGKFVDGKYVPPSREEIGKADLQIVAQELQNKFKFVKELEAAYANGPEKPSQIEKQKYLEIVRPYDIEVEQMEKEFDALEDSVNTPQEYRQKIVPFLKGKFRETIKKMRPVMDKFFSEVKNAGGTLSKPYVKMLLDRNNKDLQYLRKKMQELDEFNIQE